MTHDSITAFICWVYDWTYRIYVLYLTLGPLRENTFGYSAFKIIYLHISYKKFDGRHR